MRVTIIAEDNMVLVEEQPEKVDCSSLDEEISAIQWYGVRGEVEYKMDHVNNSRRMNLMIDDFSPYQHIVDLWTIEAQKLLPPKSTVPQPKAMEAPVHVIDD